MEILVALGNRLNDDGSISEYLRARLEKTLAIAKDYDLIVVAGGIANPKAGRTEADAMRDYLVERGVPEDKIRVEKTSKTTKENAKQCRKIFEELGVKEITLLSSAYHIDRWYLNPAKLFKRFAKVDIKATVKA